MSTFMGDQHLENLVGQQVGQYHLESLLGVGGMGQVFRGTHLLLGRQAAIKVMLSNLAAHSSLRARFYQEARAAALQQANLVEIYEFGEQEGLLFLVMELMQDGSLHDMLNRQSTHRLPLELALELAEQAAQGLAAVHARQIVHRDIKPSNLLLRRLPAPATHGASGELPRYLLKISDFGLARLLEGGVHTITGTPMGTLAYMSPEQCAGQPLDGRSDLYALGIVLYEMVTGLLPFQIHTVPEAFHKHVHLPPPSPRESCPELPSSAEALILRCLAKQPAERFASASELAQALQKLAQQLQEISARETVPLAALTSTRLVMGQDTAVTPPPAAHASFVAAPPVLVLDKDGRRVQEIEVTERGVTVGRQPDCDLVVEDPEVSRRHLHLRWTDGQVIVTDLGSANGTLVGPMRMFARMSLLWDSQRMIELGAFWLQLQMPQAPASQQAFSLPAASRPVQAAGESLPGLLSSANPAADPPGEFSLVALPHNRIGLGVTPRVLTITPGQAAHVQIVLTNTGMTVDWFTLTVEGVPAEWVQGAGQEVALNPGMQEAITLVIFVERKPANRARDYLVTIRARSRENPQEFSLSNATWTVRSFQGETVSLEPRKATGRGKAGYTVSVYNGSNVPNRYLLSGDDEEQQLRYEFRTNPVELDAGQRTRVPMEVRTRRRWLGQAQNVSFQIHTGPPGSSPTQHTPGTLVNKPLLPTWVTAVVLALMLIGGSIWGAISGALPFGPGASAASAKATQTAAAQATGTGIAQGNATSTAGAAATGIAQGSATGTAGANVRSTATVVAAATGTAGATASATAMANANLAAPTQIAPQNAQNVSIAGPVTLQWKAVTGAASYDLEIFSYAAGDTNCTGTPTPYPTTSSEPLNVTQTSFVVTSTQAVPFCWQVWAVNGAGNAGKKSPDWEFTFQ